MKTTKEVILEYIATTMIVLGEAGLMLAFLMFLIGCLVGFKPEIQAAIDSIR